MHRIRQVRQIVLSSFASNGRHNMASFQTPQRLLVSRRLSDNVQKLKSRSTTEHEKWRDITIKLLTSKGDKNTILRLLHQGEQCLKYWTNQKELKTCIEILDYLASLLATELEVGKRRRLQTKAVLNPILKLWRSTTTNGSTCLPFEMSEKLKYYQNVGLIRMDKASHGMILDAAIQDHGTRDELNTEGVYFAQTYLKEWIQEYQQHELIDANTDMDGIVVKPDIVAIGTVIQGWQKSGLPEAPHRAVEWMDICEQVLGLQPNAQLYTSVITAWAKQGKAQQAQEWIDKMRENNVVVDLATWNALLLAWAYRVDLDPSAAEEAESILRYMFRLHKEGKLDALPDVISYTTVMDAWSRHIKTKINSKAKRQAAHKALRLFQQMKESPHQQSRPNTISYNLALAICARAGMVLQAESLLQELIEENSNRFDTFTSDSNDFSNAAKVIQPNIQSVSLLLLAYSKVGTIDAAEKAERILNESLPLLGLKPNLYSYNNCISCWAKASSPKTRIPVERASALFQEISNVHGMKPDAFAYSALINAWARHGNAKQAQSLLDELWNKYKASQASGDKDANAYKPTVQTLTSVLHAWSEFYPQQAEALLQRMEKDYDVIPNVYSYSVVLNAWAKNASSPKYPDAPDRALLILNSMTGSSSKANDKRVRPNIISYTTVLQAFAKQGRAREAEALLERMLGDNDSLPSPDLRAFSAVLHAWSKSKDPQAAERAEAFLMQMHIMYQSKQLDNPPNVYCYTNVLSCFAKSRKPGSGTRALAILQSMMKGNYDLEGSEKRSHVSVVPNLVSYNNVLNALANETSITSGGDKELVLIQHIFELLDNLILLGQDNPKMLPDKWTYQAVLKALKNTRTRRKIEYVNTLLDIINKHSFEPTGSMKDQIRQLLR